MAEYTYADVIIDPEDPRVEIGEEYYWSDYPSSLLLEVLEGSKQSKILIEVDNSEYPFKNRDAKYQCLIRKKEPEKRYVPFDLRDPEQIGMLYFCWLIHKDSGDYYSVTAIHPNDNLIHIDDYGDISPQELLERFKFFYQDMPCGKLMEED